MSHPEFFWNLKCPYCLFKSGSAEGSRPLSGIGVRRDLANWTRNTFFPFAPPLAAQEKREMGHSPIPQARGTAPYPRQGAQPLATPAKRCLKGFSKIRDDSMLRNTNVLERLVRKSKIYRRMNEILMRLYIF